MSYNRLPANTPSVLRAAGLTVIPTDGWLTRGRPASTGGFAPKGVLCHHTATGPKTSNAAVVNLLIKGRSDLPGPLCQFGLARDGTVYLIASGRANHAGKAKQSTPMPAGDGNELYYGIEAFNDGVGEKWNQKQLEAYALLAAVLCVKFTKNTYGTVRGHKETSVTGKIDPTFNMASFRKDVDSKIKSLTAVKPISAVTGIHAPKTCPSKWSKFTHLDSGRYMNYYQTALHLKKGGALDVDVQRSLTGTAWALHWGTVGKNKLHDPSKIIKSTARIENLTDAQISRLRGPEGQVPRKVITILAVAVKRGIRIELELKAQFSLLEIKRLHNSVNAQKLHKAGLLQYKTLAAIPGPIHRLRPVQQAGGITILSFTDYKGKGVSKKVAWPEVDYVRGHPKWVA